MRAARHLGIAQRAAPPKGAVAAAGLADASPAAWAGRVGAAAVGLALHAAVARRTRARALQAAAATRARRRRRAAPVELTAGPVPAAAADAHGERREAEARTAPRAAACARRRAAVGAVVIRLRDPIEIRSIPRRRRRHRRLLCCGERRRQHGVVTLNVVTPAREGGLERAGAGVRVRARAGAWGRGGEARVMEGLPNPNRAPSPWNEPSTSPPPTTSL